jgi:hypothetical protein
MQCSKIFFEGQVVTSHDFKSFLDESNSIQAKINRSLTFAATAISRLLNEPFGCVIFV